MANSVDPNHPKQKLLFFVTGDLDDHIRANVRNFVEQLSTLRRWLNGPSHLVDIREEPEDANKEDTTIETLGGYIGIYSAWSPPTLPHDVDVQHLDEVTALVDALCNFSQQHGLEWELELDRTFVGTVTSGKPDRSLAEGLLGEWRRRLDTSS
jgi:hypothetical protein